jgi:Carboxypeptidase regulatory-like domain/TonB dependent receptor
MKINVLVVRIGLFFCFAAMVWAQATSQIQGTVQDATGGAVPGAEVSVTQTDTGATRTATTGGDGGYVLPNLPTGPYRMEITKAGFSKYIQTGIVLQVAVNPTIDVGLKLGAVSDQIQVEANAAQVETQATGIGAVIENQRILELPLNGRNSTDLVQISAGSVFVAPPVSRSFGGSNGGEAISVAGGQYFATSYFLDGANHNNPYDNLNLPLPFPDALQEFKVETSALTAQNGVHSGAAVNAVTKGGTNDFHGDLFYFLRNGDLNARNYFSATRDQLKRNQYGGTVGGPIKKDKVFFFFGYQGTKTRQTNQATPEFVPTAAMLKGDFSQCPTITSIKNPATGAVIPSKILPPNLISPAAVKIAAFLPPAQDSCGTVNYTIPLDQNEYQIVGRADYQLSAKQTLFGRYIATALTQAIPFQVDPNNILVSATGGRDNLAQSATFGDTYLVSATMVNSFRASVNRTAIQRSNAPDFGPQDVGIKAFSYTPNNFLLTDTGAFTIGGGTESNSSFHTTTYQLNDDYNIVHGSHQFAFGVAASKWPSESLANVRSPGVYTFSNQYTGNAIADFVTGRLGFLDQAAPNNLFMKQWYFGAYAQDTWKISPRLTANIGVRWEPFFPPSVTNNAIYNFDLNRFDQGIKSTVYATAPPGFQYPGDPGFPGQAGINTKYGDFSPRVGLAWDPKGDGKMTVRASFGIAYDFSDGQQNLNTAIAPPFGDEVRPTPSPTIDGLSNPYAGFPGGNPFPISFNPQNALYVPFGPFLTTPYNLKTPTVDLWNLTIQRQVHSWVLSGSYVGNHTTHLLLTEALNSPVFIPGNCVAGQYGLTAPGPCSSTSNYNQRRPLYLANPAEGQFIGYMDQYNAGGTQSYNGMILSAQRPLMRGVSVNANYTWSHCISDDRWGAGGTTQNVGQTILNPFNFAYDRGDCNFDKRHIANFSIVAQTPRFANRALRMVATGWQTAWIVRYQSGVALTITDSVDRQLTDVSGQRPNAVGNPYSSTASCPATVLQCVSLLNTAAFSLPALGTLGNMSPAEIRGPGFTDISMSLSRTFPITEHVKLDLRGEAFNLPNSFRAGCNGGANCSAVNIAGFGTFIGTTFGTPTFGRITSAMDPRIIQVAAKIIF